MLIKGNTGSGKTTFLINKYIELISKGAKTSEIIVLCQNSFLKEKFIERLRAEKVEGQSYQVYTFSGLAYRSILNNWPLFEQLIPDSMGDAVVSPEMAGVNITSYVLKKNVERVNFDDYLSGQNLLHQLLRRYALISNNALSQDEVAQKSALLNEAFAVDAQKVLNQTKSDMLTYRVFDYLRQSEAFMKLFQDGALRDFDGVKYLLVDDFDEMTYQAFTFVKALSEKVSEYCITFDEKGGARRGYLSAYPEGWKSFEGECLVLKSQDNDAEKILDVFEGQKLQSLEQFEFVPAEQNIEMTDNILNKLSQLLESGVKPNEIKLVAPENDFVLRHNLERYFSDNCIKYQFLSGTRRLYDDKFVFASLVILCLVHPEWGLKVQDSELKRFLVEFLGIPFVLCDSVTAHYKKHSQLPITVDLGEGITSYADFIVLVEELKAKDLSLCDELQFVFKNCILELATEADTFSFFNQLFASLDDFENLYSKMSSDIPYREWVLQVKGSIVADNPPDTADVLDDGIIISTPQKLIDCELKSKYQFWVDAKNRNWLKDDAGRIYNSWVFQKDFAEAEYTQEMHRALTLKKTGHLLRKLKYLCEQVVIFSSNLGVDGSEMQGELVKFLSVPVASAGARTITPRADQKPVLDYRGGKMAVPAVPGAGKTTVMQALIMKLIDDGVEPSSILVLTYMDSAVKTFSERIKNNFPQLNEYPYISTIHGLSRRIIADGDNAHRVGLDSDFEVCDETRAASIRARICLDNLPAGENFQEWEDDCRKNISYAKSLFVSPQKIEEFVRKNPQETQLAEFLRVYKAYERELKRLNLVDFNDLLVLSYRLLSENEDIRVYYQNKFNYVIEDEAQDSSPVQQRLIELISAKSGNIVRCGDVNQAILSTFTNSDVKGFATFIEASHKVEMTSSQRCTQKIYELANSLVAWSQADEEYKEAFYNIYMQPVSGGNPVCEDALFFESFDSPQEEQEYVLATIKKIQAQNQDFSIAVLLRDNYQIRNWVSFFEKNDLDVLCRSDDIKEKRVFKLILAMLKFLSSPFENRLVAELARVFNQCNLMRVSTVSIDYLKKLKDPIVKNEAILYEANELDNTDFVAFWWDVFYFLNKSATLSVYDFVMDFGRYYFSGAQDLSNVNLIASMLKRFETGYLRETDKEPSLKDVVSYLEQVGKSRGVKYFEDADVTLSAVEIMTMHKAKGDEFDAVFVPQFVDRYHKINPEKITLNRDDAMSIKIEKLSGMAVKTPEQKKKESAYEALRLIYVAITRAKKKLYFTAGSSKDTSEVFALLQKLAGGLRV